MTHDNSRKYTMDGVKVYHAVETDNGYCYKNVDASEDEICYISESAFDSAFGGNGCMMFTEDTIGDNGWTKKQIKERIREMIASNESKITEHERYEEFLDFAVTCVLEMLSWSEVDTYLCEYDYEEEFENFINQ